MIYLNSIEDKRNWNSVTAEFGAKDIYYSYDYCAAAARFENGTAILLHFSTPEGAIIYPIIKREIRLETEERAFDVTTPYGYGGPLVSGNKEVLRQFRNEYLQYCRQHQIVSEIIRFHPLYSNAEYMTEYCETQYIRQTTAVDLRDDLESIRSNYSKMNKRNIKKAKKHGLICRIVEKNETNIQAFLKLYNETMDRKNATGFYYFDAASIEQQLADSPLSDSHLIFAYNGEEVVAAVILYTGAEYAHYHLGASSSEALQLRPNNLIFDAMVETAKQEGCKYLHLGGGYAEGDNLFKFKTSFSNDNNYGFFIGKTIINQEKYRRLVRGAERHFILQENFFPAYRGIKEIRTASGTPSSA